jgi:hypothetical protein
MKLQHLLIIVAVIAGTAGASQGAAVLTNASFENPATDSNNTFNTPIADWSTFGDGNFAGVIYDAPDAIYSNTDLNQFATLVRKTGIFQDVGTSGAGTYTFSVWIAAESGHAGNPEDLIELKIENAAGGTFNTTTVPIASLSTTAFTQFSVSALIDPGIANVRVTIYSGPTLASPNTGTEYAFDNASITFTPVPELASSVLFAVGGVGIAIWRRRRCS